ncbi:hypothetical protein DPEC_G00001130 [Dallia pectoralis]|uniref:Uncharacterized protein n=1 Tax=Dallia pectoralis TaxID=75939 RepID=A0ACC2HIQ2_DALPE|nr:hypothetical protein DPEC_G00001130 [Dallia pectoralis]
MPSTSSSFTNRIPLSGTRTVSFPVSLLLDSNMTTYNRCRALKRRRLEVPLSNSPDDLRSHIKDAFPQLGNTPFELCRDNFACAEAQFLPCQKLLNTDPEQQSLSCQEFL